MLRCGIEFLALLDGFENINISVTHVENLCPKGDQIPCVELKLPRQIM